MRQATGRDGAPPLGDPVSDRTWSVECIKLILNINLNSGECKKFLSRF